MRSNTESHVANALPEGWLYEPEKITLSVDINTVPDFFLPEQGVIIEAKGVLYNKYDELKLLGMHAAMPLTVGDVEYHTYLVAVSCDSREISRYEANACCTFSMALTNTANVISGLHLLHWCNTHGIKAVPVGKNATHHLTRAINQIAVRRKRLQERQSNGVHHKPRATRTIL